MVTSKVEYSAIQLSSAANVKNIWGNLIYNVKAYGAKGDGVTDDTLAIQAAVNAAAATGGGIVVVTTGKYLLSATISIPKSVFIIGDGKGSDTSNTNGSGLGTTNFRWIGAAGGTMFYFKSNTTNNYLFGGGIQSCLLDGAGIAAMGIRGSSIGFMKFKALEARSFVNQGIRNAADNGVLSQFNEIDDYHFVYGASAATENAHGLVLAGNTSAGVTQNHVLSITALVNNGYAVRIEWSDNNIFEKVHAATLGTGGAINFANGIGGSAAKNLVKYVVGKMYAESQTEGNIITYAVSEGGGLIADSGAQIHYDVQDYVNDRLFTTHKYIMSDQKDINIGSFAIVDGSASAGIAALQWPCLNLADGTDGRIGISVPPPYGWNKGTIVTLRIWFTTDTVNASKQWVATIRALTSPLGITIQTPDTNPNFGVTNPNFNIPVNNAQYINQYYDVPMNIGYDKDDYVFLTIQRRGADANDTALGNIQILGASLIYQAIGPDSPGSGTWAVTKPYYP